MAILNTFHTSEFSGDSRTSSASQAFGGLAKRMIRAGVLVAFLVMGGLFLYLKAFRNASLDGVVNAPKYVIRAPIEGVFRIANLGVGSRIVPGEAIATISNERVDDQLEAELSAKLLRLIREIAAQEVILREIDTFRERLLTRLDELRKTNIRKYDQLIMGSTDRAAKLQLMTDSSFQDLQRFAMLAKAGVETPVRVEGYRRVFIQNESDSKTAARVASLTVIDKEAAEKGYFLGENVWDVPYTQQRLDEIVILSQQLALRSQVLEAEREEVTERLASERTRTALLRRLTIYSQSTAVVSALLAGDGFEVLKGEALMEVLDLSRTYLEATLPESRYERLRQGAQVRAKLVNSGTFLRRTIVCVLGPGAATSSSAGLPWVDIMITTYNEEWEVLEKWMPISFQCLGFCSVALASFPIRRVAVVQTPQSFLNYEPFRWNLGLERAIPDDGQAFYFDDQASRDAWGVSFFCGTSAILRRAALEEIGGIPEGCDTEDI